MVQHLHALKISGPINVPDTLYPMIHMDSESGLEDQFVVNVAVFLPQLSDAHPKPELVDNGNDVVVPVLTSAGNVQARAFNIEYIPATSAGNVAPFFLWNMKLTYELESTDLSVDYVDVQIEMGGIQPGPETSRGTVTTPKLKPPSKDS